MLEDQEIFEDMLSKMKAAPGVSSPSKEDQDEEFDGAEVAELIVDNETKVYKIDKL